MLPFPVFQTNIADSSRASNAALCSLTALVLEIPLTNDLYDARTHISEHRMASLKLDRMTSSQRQELAAQLAAYEKKDAELARLVEAFKADLDEAGFTAADAAALLSPARARGPAKKSAPGVDRMGSKPAPGATYTHPVTGATWTKAANGKGAPKKEFVALVAAGSTWAELKSGSSSGRTGSAKSRAKK